ncbi:mammalian cell entry protein [Mycobacterium sp. CBMA293]|uniref:mammalian cell entry protein n=1 Tax=unclassified Mycolicibacterium TaxID=2636767 RepID=UPI001321D921|nr:MULTISPECIES: mammalian cell entry protein [unclassified Mycolicibacterium]MUL47472.1 mammalian cell entry protein [Mycolicibacterium sp. CBMA 360]MUL94826.1 mammalian cell entry protein [Mycolicibacterium sp. CBMA 230]MUM35445.1 mammalian cell entry protein [Mycolicibacterium sp. CBMA 361]MUL59458.1 mammalian cell entry protein [Mycolicibacterium sp. CBMA 335]MUL71183.1 mammalian cell entry protein [Mycolicibacterium sp. CBMA 311]
MEDQPHESGDVTPGESAADAPQATPEAPQGKAARRRHRLPRHPVADAAAPDSEATERDTADAAEDAAAEEDLTSADEVAAEAAEATDATEDADATEAVEATEAADATEAPVTLVPHRPAGRKLVAAGVVAAALFVGATAFAGAAVQPYLADRALVEAKFDVAKTAAAAVTALWSYTPDDMDKLADRSQKYLAGGFADEYRKFVDSIVASNKQAQVTNQTKVMGTAVESIGANEATALVYTNSVATSPLTKGIPSLRYLSYRLILKRSGADWKVSQMNALTKLDLTPQL